jgi:hypothetical protein
MGWMTVIGDLHGRTPPIRQESYLVLLAGDLLPDEGQGDFMEGPMRRWLEKCGCPVVAVPGNHDRRLAEARRDVLPQRDVGGRVQRDGQAGARAARPVGAGGQLLEEAAMYRVKIVERSKSKDRGKKLMTLEWEFPRKVLAETVTHRKNSDDWCDEFGFPGRTTTKELSKNSGSSRAIPLKRMIAKAMCDPYVPERFTINGAGMQGHGFAQGADHEACVERWLAARDYAVAAALNLCTEDVTHAIMRGMIEYADRIKGVRWQERIEQHLSPGRVCVHKQEVNRLLEPFGWITQIVTADMQGWANFWTLRTHKDADPAFQRVARMSYLAQRSLGFNELDYGQWHLPYVRPSEREGFNWIPPSPASVLSGLPWDYPYLIKASAARAAWVSYENHDKDGSEQAVLGTWSRLVGGHPKHASPVEHQATPMHPAWEASYPQLRSNLDGWLQARKLMKGERAFDFDPPEGEIESWGDLGPLDYKELNGGEEA